MPKLELRGGVEGLMQRAALNANATNDGSGSARAGASDDAADAPEPKRGRSEGPLPRGLRRLLAREEDKERAVKRAGGGEHDGLDRRQRSRVAGRGTNAQEQELARHAAKTRAAERAGAGRQEDFKYALDAFRRASRGEVLTQVEQEWADLGATLSPAKVLGYGAGAAQEEEEGDEGDDEFEGLVDAICEQYDCDDEEAAEALEETCDEEGWNLDAAIDLLLDAGVRELPPTSAMRRGREREEDLSDEPSGSSADGSSSDGSDASEEGEGRRAGRAATRAEGVAEGGKGSFKSGEKNNQKSVSGTSECKGTSKSPPSRANASQALQLRYRTRSSGPDNRNGRTTAEVGKGKEEGQQDASSPSRLSAVALRNSRAGELLVRQLKRAIDCDDATARLLLMDKRARSVEERGMPDVAKAVRLYYEGQQEGTPKAGDKTEIEKEMARIKSASGTLHSMVLPSITLPDWDVGRAPDGGFSYPTFRRIFALFQKYQRQTNFTTTVTLKSLVTIQLRPTIEARCGLNKDSWKEVSEGGVTDEAFVQKVKDTLKPVRAMEFDVLFEGMKLKHPGNETDILATVEEWGEKWLSTEREAEEQGITLQPGKMKELFKKAVAPISRVSRLILGQPFKSTAEWYTLIIEELRLRQSYAAEADRDGSRAPRTSPWTGGASRGSSYGSTTRGRGGGRGQERFLGSGHNFRQDAQPPPNFRQDVGGNESAQFNNHSGGAEPMVYTPAGRGRGRGDVPLRGRGGGQWTSRGGRGAGSNYANERNPSRGDGPGAGRNAEQWGNRQPVNDPAIETGLERDQGGKGKWWHDSSQLNLCCKDPECGNRQEVPFCQGCGQHHHGREWCYKRREEGFNATGYWCENRRGRAPLASKTGRPFGSPPARFNHMGAAELENGTQGDRSGPGLA